MACNITIDEIVGIPDAPGSTTTDFVRVSGTLSGDECPPINLGSQSIDVVVTLDCGNGPVQTGTGSSNGNWTVDVKINCLCDQPISITAQCATNPDCRDAFNGVLPCPVPDCPDVDVDVQIGECNLDGTRSVTLVLTVNSMGAANPVVAEWDYGDGSNGTSFVINGPGTYIGGPHSYEGPGPYIAQLNYTLPENCPPVLADVSFADEQPCPGPECPQITAATATAAAMCNPDGTRTVTFNVTVSGGTPQTFHWEFGTPDNASLTVDATVPGATPTTTHPYPAPGSGESNYTATFTITGTSAECIDTVTIPVVVSGCGGDCPMIDDLSAQVGNCQNNGTREVSLNATITGGGIEQYVWAFGDGIVSTIDATVVASPITVHNYAAPGTYNATLTIVGPQRCEDQIRSITVEVPACEAPPPTPPQPQPPTICGSMIYIVAALLAIAMVATVLLLALQVCPSFAVIQVPQWAWGIIAGLWIAAAVAIIIWYALCAFRICPCPTKCDWAVMVWTATLAGAVIALFLAGCCDSWWWALVIGLGLVFAGAFFYWLFECQPGLCLVLDLLLIVFGSVAATAIAYIALVPIIQACGYIWVEVTVTSIVAVLAIAVPSCHANQGS